MGTLVKADHNLVYNFGNFFQKSFESEAAAIYESYIYSLQGITVRVSGKVAKIPNLGNPVSNLALWVTRAPAILKKLNEFRPPQLQVLNWSNDLKEKIKIRTENSAISENLKKRILSREVSFQAEFNTFIHGDPQLSNWVQRGEDFSLIDWESSGYGPAEFDLAAILVSMCIHGDNAYWPQFISNYGEYDSLAFLECLDAKFSSALSWAASYRGNEGVQRLFDNETKIFSLGGGSKNA